MHKTVEENRIEDEKQLLENLVETASVEEELRILIKEREEKSWVLN